MKFNTVLLILHLVNVNSVIENDVWMAELESFVYNAVTNPTEVKGCGDDIIFKMLSYNGHLYHLLKQVEKFYEVNTANKEVYMVKKMLTRSIPGPSFINIHIDFKTLKETYHMTDWDLNATKYICNEAVFLWDSIVRTYNMLPPA